MPRMRRDIPRRRHNEHEAPPANTVIRRRSPQPAAHRISGAVGAPRGLQKHAACQRRSAGAEEERDNTLKRAATTGTDLRWENATAIHLKSSDLLRRNPSDGVSATFASERELIESDKNGDWKHEPGKGRRSLGVEEQEHSAEQPQTQGCAIFDSDAHRQLTCNLRNRYRDSATGKCPSMAIPKSCRLASGTRRPAVR